MPFNFFNSQDDDLIADDEERSADGHIISIKNVSIRCKYFF